MAQHRYWRLFCLSTQDTSFIGITEIEMATAPGGANVCIGGTATANANQGAGLTPDKAFDGNLTTEWQAPNVNSGAGFWIAYDFGAGNAKDIQEVRIYPNKDAANRTFAIFRVQYSDDGVTWATAWNCTYNAWVVGTQVVFTIPTVGAAASNWLLFKTHSSDGGLAFACAELQFKAVAGGANLALGAAGDAFSFFDGSTNPPKAFDGNNATLYSSSGGNGAQYLAANIGAAAAITEITLIARNDGNWGQAPDQGEIWRGSDGRNWLFTGAYNVAPFTGAGQSRTFTLISALGAIVSQLALIAVNYEYSLPLNYRRFGINGLWGFPLYIER